MMEAITRHSIPVAPAMPTVQVVASAIYLQDMQDDQCRGHTRAHQDKIADRGYHDEFYVLVHTQITIDEAMRLPGAKKALDEEWTTLQDEENAWDLSTVREKQEVLDEAQEKGEEVQIANVMDIVHKKNSQLEEIFHKWKARVVERGGTTNDETDQHVVFTEQGTSASDISQANFLDMVARLPGCDGEISDAIRVFPQVPFSDAVRLGIMEKEIPTWITFLKHRWPKSWFGKYKHPVVRQIKNIYGHKLGGLIWEICCEEAIYVCGFVRVIGFECLYKHVLKGLFLTVYVDDFKMAGLKKNLAAAWADLRQYIKLDLPTPFHDSVYLGNGQKDSIVDPKYVKEMTEVYEKYVKKDSDIQWPQDASGDAMLSSITIRKDAKGNLEQRECKKEEFIFQKREHYKGQVKAWEYEMSGHIDQAIERHTLMANKDVSSLKTVATPCIGDHLLTPRDHTEKGELTQLE